ncbi:MAG: hypothetical protein ACREQI_08020 [Candidatus Binataceae bacterium]
MNATDTQREELLAQIAKIEADLDAGRYRPGPWSRTVAAVRAAPIPVRESLSADISRVSSKLHLRGGRVTMPVAAAMALEIVALAAGIALVIAGRIVASNLLALCGLALAVTALQPIVKVAAGRMLGVGYEYAYLKGVEPRFKMAYGSYLACPRGSRVVFHLSGAIGSPLGALIAALIANGSLPLTATIAWWTFWVVVAINLASLAIGLAGIARIGPLRTADASCGVAGAEIREAMVT